MGPRPTRATSRLRGAQVARPRPGNKTRGSAERFYLKTMKTSGSEDTTGKGSRHAQPIATVRAWLVRSVANPERSEGGGIAPRRGLVCSPRARSVAKAGWAGGQEQATTRKGLEAQRTGRAPSLGDLWARGARQLLLAACWERDTVGDKKPPEGQKAPGAPRQGAPTGRAGDGRGARATGAPARSAGRTGSSC